MNRGGRRSDIAKTKGLNPLKLISHRQNQRAVSEGGTDMGRDRDS